MPENTKSEAPKSPDTKAQSWWQTLPGLITAIAGTITAIAGLLAALNQVGLLPPTTTKPANSPTSSPSAQNTPASSTAPSVSPSPPPTVSATIKTLSAGQEVTPTGGLATYKILQAHLQPANTEHHLLKFKIRVTNHGQFPMNFWYRSFRLEIGGANQPPIKAEPNAVVDAQLSQESEIIFEIPTGTKQVILHIGDPGKASTPIPIDLS
jgi:hypothetical protein